MISENLAKHTEGEYPVTGFAMIGLVASNPATSAEMLSELYRQVMTACPVPVLLEKLATHPNADIDLLEALAENPSPIVRAAVARNPRAIQLIWKLSSDPNPFVRFEIASTDHFPEHVYQNLTHDEDHRVASQAKRTLASLRIANSVVSNVIDLFGNIWRKAA